MLNQLIFLGKWLKWIKKNSTFSVYDPLSVKFLIRFKLEFSRLNEHKFKHGFTGFSMVLMIQLIQLILS